MKFVFRFVCNVRSVNWGIVLGQSCLSVYTLRLVYICTHDCECMHIDMKMHGCTCNMFINTYLRLHTNRILNIYNIEKHDHNQQKSCLWLSG